MPSLLQYCPRAPTLLTLLAACSAVLLTAPSPTHAAHAAAASVHTSSAPHRTQQRVVLDQERANTVKFTDPSSHIVKVNRDIDVAAVKLITFDAYAALFLTTESLSQNIPQILSKVGVSSSKALSLVKNWGGRYFATKDISGIAQNPTLPLPKPLFELMLNQTLDASLISTGLQGVVNGTVYRDVVLAWRDLKPRPNTASTLMALRSTGKYKLGILSNGDDPNLQALGALFAPQFTFDYILGSSGANAFKPSASMYNQTVSLGYTKEQVLHVAGANYDALGARAFGLNLIWSNTGGQRFLNLCGLPQCNPDVIVNDISGVLAVLNVTSSGSK